MNIKIEEALSALKDKNAIIIDVRSPKEFAEDHIPGTINMPILDDEERHLVGWTYKQDSIDKAYEIGWSIFHKKIEDFEKFVSDNPDKKIIFACARGGFRSGCFTEHFEKKRPEIFRLEGGYKGYRAYVRDEIQKIELPKKIVVLFGLTGSGKTLMIRKLQEKYDDAIDLEGLAKHRSSLFGAVGLNPVSQKNFETELYFELKRLNELNQKIGRDYLIFEGESRKVGNAEIPKKIFDAMMSATLVKITCSVDTRAKRIMEEYFDEESKIVEVKKVVPKMTSLIGHKKVEELQAMLEEKKYFEFCKSMLVNYYDPLYTHFVKEFSFASVVSSEDIDAAVEEVEKFCKNL